MFQDKFFVYALGLHIIIASSLTIINYIPTSFLKKKEVKISIDMNELKNAVLRNSIQAETFNTEEVFEKIYQLKSQKKEFSNEFSRREHELEEYRREMQAIKHRREEAERQKRIAEENRRKKAEAERQRAIEEENRRKKAEAERQKRIAEENKRKAEAERQRAIEEENRRKKAEAERQKRIAEENKRKAEAERQKRIAEERRIATENLRQQTQRQSEKERYLNSDQGKLDLFNYFNNVNNAIQRNWTQPHNVRRGERCVVHITQSNRGIVQEINFIECSRNTNYRKEVEKAIYNSSPLPLPNNNFLFDSKIEIIFE